MSPLVCPVCRHLADGNLHVRTLSAVGGLLRCACGAAFPVIDGVPIVLRELDAWMAVEGAEALRRADLPADVAALVTRGMGGAPARNATLLAVYSRSREGALQDWLRARVDAMEGRVLEMGAGLGASARTDVVALDSNLALLRHHPGVRVCGDAADPPFLPGSFDAVVLPNLLDSTANPALVLAQADALLRPGGQLVVTCAYAFHDDVTPRAHHFAPAELSAALDGRSPLRNHRFEHRLVEEKDPIAWPLVLSDRLTQVHAAHALISVKSA